MRHETLERAARAAAVATLVLAAPALAQYREYYVRGKVVDTEGKPVAGVELAIRDGSTSRAYDVKTDKQGVFKVAGLPHAVYAVTFAKEGYSEKHDEWKLETPQDTMQRIEVPDVVLATRSQVQEAQRFRDAQAGVKDAVERLQEGDVDGAVALLEKVLSDSPEDLHARYFLGLGYARKQKYREAVDALTRVTERNPAFPGAHFELGVCYRHLGDVAKALEHYEASLAQDPAHVDSAYNSGLILFESNRIEEALPRFEQALAARPADPDVLEMVGRCHVHQGRFDRAAEHLEKARAASADPEKAAFLDELIRQVRAQIR